MERNSPRQEGGILLSHAHHLERIEETLKEQFSAHEPLVNEVTSHILCSGGKRIRPLLTVISGIMCGSEQEPLYRLSAVPEYLHAASLLHDDVVDEGQMRRGKLPAYKIWGNRAAILAGDYLYAKAIELAASFGIPAIASTIADTVAYMAEGEILQMQHATVAEYTVEMYTKVIFRKTAALLGASCKIGGLLAGEEKDADALWEYGTNLGMAFQIVDDLLDLTADEEELGKAIGTDVAEGKRTLPLLMAQDRADSGDAAWLTRLLERRRIPGPEELARLKELLEATGALADTKAKAVDYGEKAVEALAPLPDCEEKAFLADLVQFVITRRK